MTIIFSLLYTLFQTTPFFYHLTQLAFHIVNSILLFYLFRKFFPRTPAFIAALIFLIHPINTEAVVYISNLQDVLFTFFGLSGLLILIYRPSTTKFLLIAYVLFLLSLLSKETGIIFILLALLYQIIYMGTTNYRVGKFVILNLPAGRHGLVQDLKRSRNKFGMTNLMTHILLAAITVGIYITLRISAVGLYKYQTENFPMMQLSLSERLLNIPQILFYYLKTFLFPVHLAFAQNWTVKELSFTSFFLPLAGIVLVICLLFSLGWMLRKDIETLKKFYFFLALLILGLSLHLQILPLDMTVADRWFYVPIIGVLGIVGIVGEQIKILKKRQPIFGYSLLCILVFLFCLTFARSLNWQSQYTLYGHDVKYNTSSYNLLNGWASELMNVGRYDEAEPYIRKSIALEPDFCYSWNNLGSIYAIRKDYKKAR
jgi:hypothetical protein